jgi:hypothetical protein
MLAACGVSAPALDATRLRERAVQRTGLSDFGDASFEAGLQQLVQSLNAEAQLSQVGRIAARFNLLDNLGTRLRLVDARKQRPEISQQRIARPLFIVGLPRTGTTILYELIAQDPAFRAPASWQVAQPCLPTAAPATSPDPRIASTQRMLQLLESLAPGFNAIHAIGAQLPQECVYLMASHFHSEQFSYMYNVPGYRAWLLQQDMTATYQWHYRFLQHLQASFPEPALPASAASGQSQHAAPHSSRQWVLKTPAHLACLTALIQQYPDALLVWTHRKPLDAVASFCSLATRLRGGFSDAVDRPAVGGGELSHSAQVITRALEQRSHIPDTQVLDVGFDAICSDPIKVVQQVYHHFGLVLTPQAMINMQEYLQQRPRYLYGPHRYQAAQYALDASRVNAVFAQYGDRYAAWL